MGVGPLWSPGGDLALQGLTFMCMGRDESAPTRLRCRVAYTLIYLLMSIIWPLRPPDPRFARSSFLIHSKMCQGEKRPLRAVGSPPPAHTP